MSILDQTPMSVNRYSGKNRSIPENRALTCPTRPPRHDAIPPRIGAYGALDTGFYDLGYARQVGTAATAVYAALTRFCNAKQRYCWPKIKTLAAITGLSVSSVRSALKRLTAASVITITPIFNDERGGRQESNQYDLLPLAPTPAPEMSEAELASMHGDDVPAENCTPPLQPTEAPNMKITPELEYLSNQPASIESVPDIADRTSDRQEEVFCRKEDDEGSERDRLSEHAKRLGEYPFPYTPREGMTLRDIEQQHGRGELERILRGFNSPKATEPIRAYLAALDALADYNRAHPKPKPLPAPNSREACQIAEKIFDTLDGADGDFRKILQLVNACLDANQNPESPEHRAAIAQQFSAYLASKPAPPADDQTAVDPPECEHQDEQPRLHEKAIAHALALEIPDHPDQINETYHAMRAAAASLCNATEDLKYRAAWINLQSVMASESLPPPSIYNAMRAFLPLLKAKCQETLTA